MKTKDNYYVMGIYGILYMAMAAYGPFTTLYLNSLGYSNSSIGNIIALSAAFVFISQLTFGHLADIGKTKTLTLMLLLIAATVMLVSFASIKHAIFIIPIFCLMQFFVGPIFPIWDSIALEYINERRLNFGHFRLFATIGFSSMVLVAGYIANIKIEYVYYLGSLLFFISLLLLFKMPKIKNSNHSHEKLRIGDLFKVKPLMIVISFNAFIMITMAFFNNYFAIHFKEMGGSAFLYSLFFFVAASSELPFFLNAHKVIGKFGIFKVYIFSTLVLILRWIILSYVQNVYLMIAINALNGISFIVMYYCTVNLIAKLAPTKLKSTGQTISAVMGGTIAGIIATFLGGRLADIIGIATTLRYLAIVCFVATIFFIFYIRRKNINFDE